MNFVVLFLIQLIRTVATGNRHSDRTNYDAVIYCTDVNMIYRVASASKSLGKSGGSGSRLALFLAGNVSELISPLLRRFYRFGHATRLLARILSIAVAHCLMEFDKGVSFGLSMKSARLFRGRSGSGEKCDERIGWLQSILPTAKLVRLRKKREQRKYTVGSTVAIRLGSRYLGRPLVALAPPSRDSRRETCSSGCSSTSFAFPAGFRLGTTNGRRRGDIWERHASRGNASRVLCVITRATRSPCGVRTPPPPPPQPHRLARHHNKWAPPQLT